MDLTDLASLKRAFYRLMNSSSTDDALIEHDSASDEAIELLLRQGLDDAQLDMYQAGRSEFWLTTSSTLTYSTDSDYADLKYWAWPDGTGGDARLFRIAGDRMNSPLVRSTGERWGREVHPDFRFRVRNGRYFWYENERIYFASGAQPPSDLKCEYIRRANDLADSTDADFPAEDRPLIVAHAAVHGMEEAWLPGGQEMEMKLLRNLERRQQQAWARAPRSKSPRRARPRQVIGEHYFVTG